MGDFSNPDPSGGLPPFFVVFIVIFGIVFVGAIIRSVYTAARVKQSGHNPLTLETDLAVAALDSTALSPTKSLEQRLAEVDDLLARGVISDAEHQAARAAILAG